MPSRPSSDLSAGGGDRKPDPELKQFATAYRERFHLGRRRSSPSLAPSERQAYRLLKLCRERGLLPWPPQRRAAREVASIEKRPDGSYRARDRDPSGRERARHFDRKVDGERWLDGICGELVRGAYIDPDAGKVTVRELAEQWKGMHAWRVNTVYAVEEGRITRNPAVGVRLPKIERPPWCRCAEQVWALAVAAPPLLKAAVVVGDETRTRGVS